MQVTAIAQKAPGSVGFRPPNSSQAGTEDGAEAVAEYSIQLRERLAVADRGTTVQLSLSLLWRELSRGLCKIVDTFFTADRCFIVTQQRTGLAVPLEGRRLAILEAVLCGVGQKNIAIEMGLAPSTIALNARLALEYLGVGCRPSRAHPLLMMSACAARVRDANEAGALSFVAAGSSQLRVVSVPRPDSRLTALLPPAERAVIRCLVEGASYVAIADSRGTSTRTIANQITAVFRRLRVSGRSELLIRLFAEHVANQASDTIAPSCLDLECASAS